MQQTKAHIHKLILFLVSLRRSPRSADKPNTSAQPRNQRERDLAASACLPLASFYARVKIFVLCGVPPQESF